MAEQSIDSILTNPAFSMPSAPDALYEGIQHCTLCGRTIDGRYAMVKSKIACVTCAARERDSAARMGTAVAASTSVSSANVPAAITTDDSSGFAPALLYGTGAAVLGLAFYASFTIITHMYLGYVAVVVGYLVAKAMMKGSGGVGGAHYQVAAVALTYAAISLASIPIHLSHVIDKGAGIDWATEAGPLLLGGIASPFLALAQGAHGIIRLVILFVGLRVAFRLTREDQPKGSAL